MTSFNYSNRILCNTFSADLIWVKVFINIFYFNKQTRDPNPHFIPKCYSSLDWDIIIKMAIIKLLIHPRPSAKTHL